LQKLTSLRASLLSEQQSNKLKTINRLQKSEERMFGLLMLEKVSNKRAWFFGLMFINPPLAWYINEIQNHKTQNRSRPPAIMATCRYIVPVVSPGKTKK